MGKELGIHVIGGGFGESIVVTMPNGGVGVIDCFCAELDPAQRGRNNPTIRFLRNELKAERLAFVAFTHPHEDHGRGLSHILEEYKGKIGEIWAFDGIELKALEVHFQEQIKHHRRLPVEEILKQPPGTFRLDLQRFKLLMDKALDKSNVSGATFTTLAGYQRIAFDGEKVVVHVLGPSHTIASRYTTALAGNAGQVIKGKKAAPAWEPESLNHNIISAAFLVVYGKSRVLLGGDMEQEGWRAVEREQERKELKRPLLASQVVKASHHGSATGYTDTLYDKFAHKGRKPVVVVTPFTRHAHPLPSRAGMAHLKLSAREILTTHLAATRKSSTFAGVAAVPARWQKMILKQKSLGSLLMPGNLSGGQGSLTLPAVPAEWIADILKQPGLAGFLREDVVGMSMAGVQYDPQPEQNHRVSIYLDDKGNELRRFVGAGGGIV